MVLEVTYDLHAPGRDYDDIAKVLKSASGGWAHPQGSVWFIDTLEEPSWWVDRLKEAGDPNDEYLVSRLQKHWWSYKMDQEVVHWLKASSRRW